MYTNIPNDKTEQGAYVFLSLWVPFKCVSPAPRDFRQPSSRHLLLLECWNEFQFRFCYFVFPVLSLPCLPHNSFFPWLYPASSPLIMSQTLKEVDSIKSSLSCSICLEIFTNPLSLPCGHTFCQACIHGHWDSLNPVPGTFSCPDCRGNFPQRPEPQKNVCLQKVVDDWKVLEQMRILVAPALGESGPKGARTVCQDHNQELTLYCCTEKRCICCKCMLKSCRNHNLQDIEEQSEKERVRENY